MTASQPVDIYRSSIHMTLWALELLQSNWVAHKIVVPNFSLRYNERSAVDYERVTGTESTADDVVSDALWFHDGDRAVKHNHLVIGDAHNVTLGWKWLYVTAKHTMRSKYVTNYVSLKKMLRNVTTLFRNRWQFLVISAGINIAETDLIKVVETKYKPPDTEKRYFSWHK